MKWKVLVLTTTPTTRRTTFVPLGDPFPGPKINNMPELYITFARTKYFYRFLEGGPAPAPVFIRRWDVRRSWLQQVLPEQDYTQIHTTQLERSVRQDCGDRYKPRWLCASASDWVDCPARSAHSRRYYALRPDLRFTRHHFCKYEPIATPLANINCLANDGSDLESD